jgi:DNA-binding PadR family transcriptional regulator
VKALREMQRRYFLETIDVTPRLYYRLTDNWLELAVRFVVRDHGIRETKDQISREVLDRFREAGIDIASATVEVVGVPPLRVDTQHPAGPRG